MSTTSKSRMKRKEGIVYERLREAIRHGYFYPGERIVERTVANQLAVSRTPVREALLRLTQEGLVIIDDGAWRVPSITSSEAEHLYEVRGLLERQAAVMAAERRTKADLDAMHATLDLSQKSAEQHRVHDLIEMSQRFHQLVTQASHNPYYGEFLRIVQGRTSLTMYISLNQTNRPPESIEEHRELLSAIEAGDSARAASLAELHTRRSLESVKAGIGIIESRAQLLKTIT